MVQASPLLLAYRDRAVGGLIILLTLIGLAMAYAPARPEPTTAQAAPVIIIATPALSQPNPPTPAAVSSDRAPSAALAAATVVPPTEAPTTAEPQIVYIEVTSVPTEAPPTAEPPTEAPTNEPPRPTPAGQTLASGVIILPTPGPGDPGFAESFATPDPKAKCLFVGCIGRP